MYYTCYIPIIHIYIYYIAIYNNLALKELRNGCKVFAEQNMFLN